MVVCAYSFIYLFIYLFTYLSNLRGNLRGRRDSLTAVTLVSESSGPVGPGSSSGRLWSKTKHFTPTVPLPTQVYNWVPTPYNGLASHPGGRG